MQVSPITELGLPTSTERVGAGAPPAEAPADGPSFADVFGQMLETANRADAAASQKTEALASGASDDLHGTMIAVKEADISIKLVASIRNKLLDAFNDVWKTSV
jgi:flagellar hook-basal body complex protein FliE